MIIKRGLEGKKEKGTKMKEKERKEIEKVIWIFKNMKIFRDK